VLRRNHHVAGILNGDPKAQVANTLLLLEGMARERKTVLMQTHPPVLLDCARLINIFETRGQVFVEPQATMDIVKGADYKMRIPEHMRGAASTSSFTKGQPSRFSAIDLTGSHLRFLRPFNVVPPNTRRSIWRATRGIAAAIRMDIEIILRRTYTGALRCP
jgi:hypothetical protein